MNCSKCGKPLAAGAKKCACGTEAASSYSYDLLPEEEPKKKDSPADTFALPPGAALPPPVALGGGVDLGAGAAAKPAKTSRSFDRSRGASLHGGGGLSLKKIGLIAGVGLIVVLLGMRMCSGTKAVITMNNPKASGASTLYPNMQKIIPFQLVGAANYTLQVEAVDGDVSIGVVERGARDKVTPEVVKTWSLTPVKKGEKQVLTNNLGTGSYSFVMLTDTKKGVKIKYEYLVK
jgi:hypothetical protein